MGDAPQAPRAWAAPLRTLPLPRRLGRPNEAISLAAAAEAGIEDVSQSVAHEVEAEDGEAEGHTGTDDQPGSADEVLPVCRAEVDAPGGRANCYAVAEE